jgi:hypothetical protein
MEGASLLTTVTLLFAGVILLPTNSTDLGIILLTFFWVPYGLYRYTQRVCGHRRRERPQRPKAIPTAPVYEGPLPIAVVVEEDPCAL